MFVFPFILGILFIILIFGAPFIFRFVFKIEKSSGFCFGFCCFLTICIIFCAITAVETYAFGSFIEKYYTELKFFSASSLTNINYLLKLSFSMRLIIWLIDAFFKAISFLIIFFYVGIISSPKYICNIVFIFLSGYTLSYAFYYLIMIIYSCGADTLIAHLGQQYNEDGNPIPLTTASLVYLEFMTLLDICLYSGAILMILLYRKGLNEIVIWICITCFFVPLIFEFIGLCGIKFFYTYLTKISYLCSITFGIIFYYKFANDNAEMPDKLIEIDNVDDRTSDENEYNDD